MVFFVVGPLKFFPPPPNGLVVHATLQLPGEFSPFIEKKVVFCLVVGGVTPPPLLVVRPLKKPLFFMCVFPNASSIWVIYLL